MIEATKNFNDVFQERAKPRDIEPHWISILQKIEAIELEIKKQGFVRNYSIYTDQSDAENDQEPPNELNSLNETVENLVPQLEPIEEPLQAFSEDETLRPDHTLPENDQREDYRVLSEDEFSDNSDGPGDGVLVASEISLGGIDLDSSTSSFMTSSEDDLAISEDLRTSDSHSGMAHKLN